MSPFSSLSSQHYYSSGYTGKKEYCGKCEKRLRVYLYIIEKKILFEIVRKTSVINVKCLWGPNMFIRKNEINLLLGKGFKYVNT